MSVEVRVLGPLELTDGSAVIAVPSRRQRQLLAVLVVHRGEVVSAGALAEALWPGGTAGDTRAVLQNNVSQLRRSLAAAVGDVAVVETVDRGYRLHRSVRTDVERFDRLVAAARDHLGRSKWSEAVASLVQASACWRGAPYDGLTDVEPVFVEAQRLDSVRLGALEERIGAELRLGRHRAVTSELEVLVRHHPLREELRMHLMRALYASGRQAEALRAYADLREHLAEELGLEPSPAARALEAEILAQTVPSSEPSARAAPPPGRPTTPVHLTSFVGREADRRSVVVAVSAGRLVTIVGPGGIGKTRLAVASMGELHGAEAPVFVDLSVVEGPEGVDDALATTMGVMADDRPRRSMVVDAIGSRALVLVLDNAEHLLDKVSELAADLLALCPSLRLLVTSREPLGINGEHVQVVGPLPADAARALFLDRARAVNATAALAPDAVAGLCGELDGMPLAIELAAARVRSMSPAEITEHLRRLGDLKAGTPRRAPARHRTMRAAIDGSYEALDRPTRLVFDRLSIFPGTFDRAAAAAVAAGAGIDGTDLDDELDRLVATSMLSAEVGERSTRYRMLVPLRSVGRQHLGDRIAAVADGHARYFGELVRERGGFDIDETEDRLDSVLVELDNLRAAVRHALATRQVTLALELTVPLAFLFLVYLVAEVGFWVADAADAADGVAGVDEDLRCDARGQAALAAALRLDAAVFHRHVALGGASWWTVYARCWLPASLEEWHASAVELVRLSRAMNLKAQVSSESMLMLTAALRGELPEPSQVMVEWADRRPVLGGTILRLHLIERALREGDRDAARRLVEEIAVLQTHWRQRGITYHQAHLLRAVLRFDIDRAAGLREIRQLLVEMRRLGRHVWVQCALARAAGMLDVVGRQAPALALATYTREPAYGAVLHDGDPGQEVFDRADSSLDWCAAAMARGRSLSFDEAVSLALDELDAALTSLEG